MQPFTVSPRVSQEAKLEKVEYSLLTLVGMQGASIQPHQVVKAWIFHPGGEVNHLFMVMESVGDLVLLGIDFGGKAGFVVDIDGPSVSIWNQKSNAPIGVGSYG